MSLDAHAFMTTMENRVGFTKEDKTILKSNADRGKSIAGDMAVYFYDYLGRDPEMKAIVHDKEGRSHRLRETFVQWFHEMLTGMDDWSNAYAERHWRIGLVHVQIGIELQHVVPAMATVIHEVKKRLKADGKDEIIWDTISRICMIDLAFIEQAYVEVSSAAVMIEAGWTENLFRRLITTGAGSM